ncbi:hypothetical protein [Pedobacter sp. GR22-6]|uniref:hypothetical protein n=1 Tax=Pedobacter sp. GR22-6 TaxID=3127957 RepID=UPI00307D7EEC
MKRTDDFLNILDASPDTLTKAEAYRLYGKDKVRLWCSENLIHPVGMQGSGKKKFIDRLKLEAVARADNR